MLLRCTTFKTTFVRDCSSGKRPGLLLKGERPGLWKAREKRPGDDKIGEKTR